MFILLYELTAIKIFLKKIFLESIFRKEERKVENKRKKKKAGRLYVALKCPCPVLLWKRNRMQIICLPIQGVSFLLVSAFMISFFLCPDHRVEDFTDNRIWGLLAISSQSLFFLLDLQITCLGSAVVQSRPRELQHPRLPCPPLSPGVCWKAWALESTI